MNPGPCSFCIALSLGAVLLPVAAIAAADGYFDASWAGGGRIEFAGDIAKPSIESLAQGVIAEPTGNLLVWGSTFDEGWLAELLPDGQFVPTFGASDGSGRITFDKFGFGGSTAPNAVAVLPGNQYLILTSLSTLMRTTAQAHALDTYAFTNFTVNNAGGSVTGVNAIALTGGGKVLVAGFGQYSGVDTAHRFGVLRLNSDLSLDTTFNATTDNKGTTFFGGAVIPIFAGNGAEEVTDIFVQPDGRIVLVGRGESDTCVNVPEAARLMPDGALDGSFGTNGIVGAAWSAGDICELGKAAMDRAGRILLPMSGSYNAGSFFVNGNLVLRLKPDGSPDTDFAGSGFSFSADTDQCSLSEPSALALDSAGRIVLAGHCNSISGPNYFMVERLRGDNGNPDGSFGVSGYALGAYVAGNGYSSGNAVTFDASSHPVIAGVTEASGENTFAGVARVTYDLIDTNNFETMPRGCLPPGCN